MNFSEAYEQMLEGKKVKRPDWKGYWFIENDKVKIKFAGGEIKENRFTQQTIKNTAADDWEVCEEPKSKVWKPKPQEMYYFLCGDGSPTADHNLDDGSTEKFISIGNCFKTGKEAKHMVEKIKIINKLRELSNTKFNEDDDRHYMIAYCKDDGELVSDFCYGLNSIPFNVFFKTREDCENAIDTIGVENLKKILF